MSTSHDSSSLDEAKRPSAQEKGTATQIQKPGEEDAHTLVSYDDAHLGAELANEHPAEHDNKSAILAKDFRTMAKVSVVFILIVTGLALAGYLLKFIWVGLLPVLLAILVSTVLYPISAWLRSKGFPRSLAAVSTLLGLIIVFCGVFAAMAPVVTSQSQTLINQAEDGINQLTEMVEKSPIDIQSDQLQSVLQDVVKFAKGQASTIATGVISGFSMASSIVVAALIMLFVTFFIIKDGDKFLPWLRKYTGNSTGWHVTELGARIWKTLSGFIQAQAAVAMVDAVLIGLGLWVLQVPLALVIAVVTFFASFIPIIGAVTAGALAVIIALVSNGLTNALLALALIIIVQQVEGNILQPMLQSKAMGLHAAVVLLSVTIGSTLAGIVGAFLAVPVAATIAVVVRYHAEMAALRSGEVGPSDIDIITGSKDDPEEVSDAVHEHDETPRDKVEQLYQSMSPLS
ncbi:AI-2E family transporter [Corynebacterium sp. p3-SID1241]|uniref:AI-2E family transporter n=1 Tax=Corynebacterium sp. p3-SID1241 TaxID=2916102 RepID=UPI0021A81257|nr:AI-2E family transporter [Corynebacterium sp. p3-SID1241]MCT1427633.1 AI-2E family transporter [Corynebacterium sp. p3-SID1241]